MKFQSHRPVILASAFISLLAIFPACSSMTKKNPGADAPGAAAHAAVTPTVPLSSYDLDGSASSIDGKSTTARAIITYGESRHPVFIDQTHVAFASRRAMLDRWQVFEADLAKNVERRISFDAGDAEPVVTFGRRLAIASTSDERKSGARVLDAYLGKADQGSAALQHLMLEHPANGRKGTEWVRMSRAPARQWTLSLDRDMKTGVAVMIADSTELYRIAIATKAREPETRAWYPLKVEEPNPDVPDESKNVVKKVAPKAAPKIVDGRIFPDGSRIAWSNGSILWTTNLKGGDPKRLGTDAIPSAVDLAIDPTGQWIVFSSPSPSRGRNLLAIHQSGRCLKTLTELPGDELEPAFSPDGQTLLFTVKQGDTSLIARTSFGSADAIKTACP